METYANSIEDHLIDGLTFKLDPTANYVVERQSVTYYTQGANIYQSGTGSRVIRFSLSGNGQYLDPSTVRFVFTLKNEGAANEILFPLGGPWSFFRRIRCYSGGGAVLEDIDYANRIHEMMHILTSTANRQNDAVESFGAFWDSDGTYGTSISQLRQGQQKTVSFKPLFGIFNQPKYLPLQFLPLTLEFELVTSATDAIATEIDQSTLFTPATTSQAWSISDCQIKADVIQLDSGLNNEYTKHLLSGASIPINYCSYITQLQTTGNGDVAVNISRSCTRLKTLFINFDKAFTPSAANNSITQIYKPWNRFWHPMQLADGNYDYTKELQVQVIIGNRTYPIMPIRSGAEAYYQLQKSLGIHGSAWHSISIDSLKKYMNDHFIIGLDTEKVLGASFSGINCRQDLLTVQVKGVNGTLAGATAPDQIYVVLNADFIVEIRDTGVTVFD